MKKYRNERLLIYLGLRRQKDIIGDYIDDIDMALIYTESRTKIRKLEAERDKLCRVLNRGYGIVRVPREDK